MVPTHDCPLYSSPGGSPSHHKDSLAAIVAAAELFWFIALRIQINCHSFLLIYCAVICKILKIIPFTSISDVRTAF